MLSHKSKTIFFLKVLIFIVLCSLVIYKKTDFPVLATSYLISYVSWKIWLSQEESWRSEIKDFFFFLSGYGFLFFHDLRVLFLIWFVSFLLKWKEFCFNTSKSDLIQKGVVFSFGILSFLCLYHIFEGNIIHETVVKNSHFLFLTILFVFLCFSTFPFLFHGSLLRKLHKNGVYELQRRTLPHSIILAFILFQKLDLTEVKGLAFITLAGLAPASYLTLVSFQTKNFSSYLFYILKSSLLIVLSLIPISSNEGLQGACYLTSTLILGITALSFCLSFLNKRYGFQKITSPYMGLSKYNQTVSTIFLFFVLILSNVPLTLSFAGEDILIYDVFQFSWILGFCVLTLLSLNALSLFRFYGFVFNGEEKKGYPQFCMLKKEKIAFTFLVLCGFLMPFIPIF